MAKIKSCILSGEWANGLGKMGLCLIGPLKSENELPIGPNSILSH